MSITQYNSSVRQMSQSKFNSMKNSSGKIPDLANQIVMTNSEDSNISCLRTEVVYDMTSSDASKNWGYPNGIQGNVSVTKDLTKYQYIDIVPQVYKLGATNTGGWSGVYRLDLTSQRVSGDWYVATYTTAYADASGAGGINNEVWKIVFYYQLASKTFKWLVQFNGTSYNNNSNSVITKIYGVLKTPSMIYTGKELTAGNGITINNGVISGIKSEIVWSGTFAYTAVEQTMSLDLSKYKYVEFMTTTGNILPMNLQDTRPNGDLYVYQNAESYYSGSWHGGTKCQGTYYYETKQLKWSGNYCGLAQVRGYWW